MAIKRKRSGTGAAQNTSHGTAPASEPDNPARHTQTPASSRKRAPLRTAASSRPRRSSASTQINTPTPPPVVRESSLPYGSVGLTPAQAKELSELIEDISSDPYASRTKRRRRNELMNIQSLALAEESEEERLRQKKKQRVTARQNGTTAAVKEKKSAKPTKPRRSIRERFPRYRDQPDSDTVVVDVAHEEKTDTSSRSSPNVVIPYGELEAAVGWLPVPDIEETFSGPEAINLSPDGKSEAASGWELVPDIVETFSIPVPINISSDSEDNNIKVESGNDASTNLATAKAPEVEVVNDAGAEEKIKGVEMESGDEASTNPVTAKVREVEQDALAEERINDMKAPAGPIMVTMSSSWSMLDMHPKSTHSDPAVWIQGSDMSAVKKPEVVLEPLPDVDVNDTQGQVLLCVKMIERGLNPLVLPSQQGHAARAGLPLPKPGPLEWYPFQSLEHLPPLPPQLQGGTITKAWCSVPGSHTRVMAVVKYPGGLTTHWFFAADFRAGLAEKPDLAWGTDSIPLTGEFARSFN